MQIDGQEILTMLMSAIILTITFVIPMQSLYRESSSDSKEDEQEEESKENAETSNDREEAEPEMKEEEKDAEEEIEEAQPIRRTSFVAHREVLEEIPEAEVEYETQRESNDGLEEILEEEEENSVHEHLEDDLEIIEEEQEEEEQGGEEDYWAERRKYIRRKSYSRDSDRDLDDWELTNGQGRNGAQQYRFGR